ncbi:MAG: nucleoside hydrolase [bacterium]
MAQKVVIDCDPGVDDALALILAFYSPELEIEAITGVNGNVPVELVMQNIKKMLSLIRPTHLPWIAQGAARPLVGKSIYAYEVHGADGLGGARLDRLQEEEFGHYSSKSADELILEMADKYAQELILIAIGPLTNIALAIKKDLATIKKIRKIIIMGGAVKEKGNITPYAEFNFYVDPLAAKIVLEADLPITLIPLDVTHQVYLTAEEMEIKGRQSHAPFLRFLIEATGYDFQARNFRGNKKLFYLHDPLAVAVAIDEQLVEKEKMPLSVEVEEGLDYGKVKQLSPEGFTPQGIDVALKVNRADFLKFFWDRLSG